jgi:hypothetical protein
MIKGRNLISSTVVLATVASWHSNLSRETPTILVVLTFKNLSQTFTCEKNTGRNSSGKKILVETVEDLERRMKKG